ncbi:MAG: hypothetical protein IJL93_08385 [Bacteroidales bacterium]|nr:hypothetical protein [Bacteroidales bacterium]
MTTIFLSVLCAAVLSTGTATAPVDTINRYIIDMQTVENFDGSQIKGARIESYDITILDGDGQPVRVHDIRTDRGNKPLIIINGKAVPYDSMLSIDPASIEIIEVTKGGDKAEAYATFGETRNGVIVIKVKTPGTFTPSGQKLKTVQIRSDKPGDKTK